jgi:hypothetical protein
MVHLRCSSIAVALASILASGVESADTRGSSGLRLSKDASASKETSVAVDAIGRMIKYEKTDENGVKCKAGADKKKMYATRECEGGAKEVGIGIFSNVTICVSFPFSVSSKERFFIR